MFNKSHQKKQNTRATLNGYKLVNGAKTNNTMIRENIISNIKHIGIQSEKKSSTERALMFAELSKTL